MTVTTLSASDHLAKALEIYFADAHMMCTHDDQPVPVKDVNAFVSTHLGDLEELVCNYVAEQF